MLQSMGSERVRNNWATELNWIIVGILEVSDHACYNWGLPRWRYWKRTCLPMQETSETWVQSLGLEDPLEEGMATYSSILAWRVPWTEEPGWLQLIGSQRVRHDWSDLVHTHSQRQVTETDSHDKFHILINSFHMYIYTHKMVSGALQLRCGLIQLED